MSTATLLIVSTRLREHAIGEAHRRPASSAPISGRSRVVESVDTRVVQLLALFRHGRAGTGLFRDALPGMTAWRVGSGAADIESRVPSGSPGSVPAIARATDARRFRRICAGATLSDFTLCRQGKRQAGAGLAILPQYARAGLVGLVCFVLTAGHALAQVPVASETTPKITLPTMRVEAQPETRIGGGPPPTPCVVVDIVGHRAGHLECASEALEEAARIARKEADAAREISIPEAGSPDVQIGVASRSATRLRLRENFGVSIRPPAVTSPVFTPPTGPRR